MVWVGLDGTVMRNACRGFMVLTAAWTVHATTTTPVTASLVAACVVLGTMAATVS